MSEPAGSPPASDLWGLDEASQKSRTAKEGGGGGKKTAPTSEPKVRP